MKLKSAQDLYVKGINNNNNKTFMKRLSGLTHTRRFYGEPE